MGDPELMAAYAEAQAELANMMPKKKKKKKNKKGQLGAEVAELENLIKQLEGTDDIAAADAALEALKMSEPKKKKKKKQIADVPADEELFNTEDLQDLPPEVLEELRNYEPTEEEIAAEFEQLKAEKDKKKKKKIKKKKEEQIFDLGVDEETGEALRMDDPELLRELIDQEEDPTMKKHLQKLLK